MKLRGFFELVDEYPYLGILCISIFCFFMAFIGYWYSDMHQDKKMIDVANQCKADAMKYDFVSAHENLIILENDYTVYKGDERDELKEIKKKRFDDTFNYVLNAELMYLCSKGDKESIDRITFLLSGIPIKSVAISEGEEFDDIDEKIIEEHNSHVDFVSSFNQKCSMLIDMAIAHHNYAIVENVFPLFKPVPQKIRMFHSVKVQYSNSDSERAKEKINKAIKSNVFPLVTKELN